MKRNVDLTQNRIFSNNFGNMTVNAILNGRRIIINGVYPWDYSNIITEVNSDDELDMDHQKRSIIALGDKAMRSRIKEFRQMDSLNYCDCCGIRMNLKPWDREYGVCHRCNSYYLKDDDKCKWRKLKERIENAVIRTA